MLSVLTGIQLTIWEERYIAALIVAEGQTATHRLAYHGTHLEKLHAAARYLLTFPKFWREELCFHVLFSR